MAKQRVINTHFWNDDFVLDLRADEKLLFLYILTNPQTDLCGAYQIALKRITFDTRISPARVLTILGKFEGAGKICYRDGWMMVKNFAKHQVSNPKVTAGIVRSLNSCPDWVKHTLSTGFDSLSKGVALLPELKPQPSDVSVPPVKPVPPVREIFIGTVTAELEKRMDVKLSVTSRIEWQAQAEWAHDNGFTVEQVLECYDLLTKQLWRDGPVKPKHLAENLPNLHKLRAEIEKQINGTNTRHGSGGKPTAASVVEGRDYR